MTKIDEDETGTVVTQISERKTEMEDEKKNDETGNVAKNKGIGLKKKWNRRKEGNTNERRNMLDEVNRTFKKKD